MSDHFISILSRLAKLEAEIRELTTRVPALQLATVTDINEPRRMIRVTREAQGGQSQSYWIQAGRRSCFEDEPLPVVGTTALIGFCDSNPHDGYLIRTFTNDTNPGDPVQQAPAKDHTSEIPGDDRRVVVGKQFDTVGGDRTQETEGNLVITAHKDVALDSVNGKVEITATSPDGEIKLIGFERVRLQDESGAYIQIQDGAIEVRNASGQKWELGGANGNQWRFDLGGGTLEIINAANAKINGKSIAVVGAVDNRGDALINKGY